MHPRLHKLVNGGLAVYYGLGSAVLSIGILIGQIVWVVKYSLGKSQFSLEVFGLMIGLSVIFGLIGYALLRVGFEEIKE